MRNFNGTRSSPASASMAVMSGLRGADAGVYNIAVSCCFEVAGIQKGRSACVRRRPSCIFARTSLRALARSQPGVDISDAIPNRLAELHEGRAVASTAALSPRIRGRTGAAGELLLGLVFRGDRLFRGHGKGPP